MATKALVGISTIEYGTVTGDETMPTSLTEIGIIVPDSVILTFDPPEKNDLFIEGQVAPYITIPNPNRIRTFAFRVRDMEPETLELFFGGDVDSDVWSAPTEEEVIFKALKITSKTYDTTLFEIEIPKALLLASLDGKMYQQDTSEISVTAHVQAVFDSSGDPASPIQITKTN